MLYILKRICTRELYVCVASLRGSWCVYANMRMSWAVWNGRFRLVTFDLVQVQNMLPPQTKDIFAVLHCRFGGGSLLVD